MIFLEVLKKLIPKKKEKDADRYPQEVEKMEKMESKKTILMGVYNNKILTADVELRDWNGYPEFSACFNVGEAFNVDSIDNKYLENYFLEMWNSCYGAADKLYLLNDGEKTKKDVINEWIDTADADYHEVKDCSCTDYELNYHGKTINFETIGCGQHDVREDDDFDGFIFTDEKLFNDIMYLWDNYHIKEVKGDALQEIQALLNMDHKYEEGTDEFDDFIVNNITWSTL